MRRLSIIVLFLSFAFVSCNSKSNVAYFNSVELLALFPETKNIDSSLQILSADLNKQLAVKQQSLQKEFTSFVRDSSSLSADVKELRRSSLVSLNNAVQEFQNQANQTLNNKRTELTGPLFKKINDAVSEIAKSKGYSVVFDSGVTPFVYKNESDDILPALKLKLGVK